MNISIKFVLFVFAVFSALSSCYASDLSIKQNFKLDKLTKNVYVIHGPNETASKKNQGFVNNPVLVKIKSGIVVIDPGSSVYTGELVVKKAKEISNQPIIAVFNTHVHGDHWLGNHGIVNSYHNVDIYAHEKMKTAITAGDGKMWITAIDKRTEGMIKGTKVVSPTKTVKHGDSIQLGGITFRIYHNGKAHSNNDIMIEIVEEKVFVFGDNLRHNNLSLFMASFKGNLEALAMGEKTNAKVYVPGHGASGDKSVIAKYRQFIIDLKNAVSKHYKAGLSDYEMKPKVIDSLKKYKDWTGFDENIGRLINLAYLEVESELF